jgi:hypothetical protein
MVEAGGSTAVAPIEINPGQPLLRWSSRAHTLDEIQRELGRIWARPPGAVPSGEDGERHVAARTSVLNLVVVVRRPEVGTRAAATISQLTGRHPSRTLVVSSIDPDGPSWLDAQIQAFCVVPRADAAETCAEMIYLSAGGEAGRHLQPLIAPLLIHDLPVTMWVPGELGFSSQWARDLVDMADRIVVDGSGWSGNGLTRLGELATLAHGRISISDFALMRQSRWREAIAATFDVPEFTPFLRFIRRIAVTYATHDETGDPETTNIVKPIYHVAWVAGRLGMHVVSPLAPIVHGRRSAGDGASRRGRGRAPGPRPGPAPVPGGFDATLRHGPSEVSVVLRPRLSGMPSGTTLRVELLAERRGSELRTDVTAEADTVHCRVWQDGVDVMERRFNSSRRVDVDLLAEAIESTVDDRIERETIRTAGSIVAAREAGGEAI